MSDYQMSDAEEYRQQQAFLRQHEGEIGYAFTVYLEQFKEQRTGENTVAFVPNGWTLYAEKSWVAKDITGDEFYQGSASLKLAEGGQADLDSLQKTAQALNDLLDKGDLSLAMQRAEKLAVQNGFLDAKRDDPRLFTEGPEDPFATLRELEQERAQDAYVQFTAGYAAADVERTAASGEKPEHGFDLDL
jgi:hypothetical protein